MSRDEGLERLASRCANDDDDWEWAVAAAEATIQELIDVCLEAGVELQACQMTLDLMGYDADDFIEGVTVGVGAATAIDAMADADVQLFVRPVGCQVLRPGRADRVRLRTPPRRGLPAD